LSQKILLNKIIKMKHSKQKIHFLSPLSDRFIADDWDDWYNFATSNHFWIKWRFEALKKIIPKSHQWGQTLDIGCGTGIVRNQIEKTYGCVVSGCDLNIKALQLSIESKGPLYFYNIHQKNKEFKEYFSTILLLDVLEHIEDPITFLDSINYHLKKNGRLIINVPAFQFLYSIYDRVVGHFRRYKISTLKDELNHAGFCIEKASYWGMSLIPLAIARKFILHFYKKDKIVKAGFQPVSPLINSVMHFIMKIEYAIFATPPFGTSLIVIARKEITA